MNKHVVWTSRSQSAFFTAFRRGFNKPPRLFNATALVATILLSIGPDYSDLIQRIIFLIAYCWFAREVLQVAGWLRPRNDESDHPMSRNGAGAQPS